MSWSLLGNYRQTPSRVSCGISVLNTKAGTARSSRKRDERRKDVCTTLPVKAKADSVIIGHTREFGIDLQSNTVVVPRRRDNIGTGPKGLPGLRRCSTRSSKPDNTEIETSAHGCYGREAVLSLFAKEPRRH